MCLERKRGRDFGGSSSGNLRRIVASCNVSVAIRLEEHQPWSVFPRDLRDNQMSLRAGVTVATYRWGQRSLEPEMKMLREAATQAF